MKREGKWKIILGGNFLQIWQEGKYEPADSLTYESGAVCDMKLPNIHEKGITYGKAMEIVMPRARLIVDASNAAREINPENPTAAAAAMPEIVKALEDLLKEIHDGITPLLHRGKPGAFDICTRRIARARTALANARAKGELK